MMGMSEERERLYRACIDGSDHMDDARALIERDPSYKAIRESLRHLRNSSLKIEEAEEALGQLEAKKMRGEVKTVASS